MKNTQKGFTLIELMIVVAIIGILASIALPAYQDYTKRAHVTEGISLASAAKMGITEYYSVNNAWPDSNTAIGLDEDISGNAVEEVKIGTGGVITIKYTTKVVSDTAANTVTLIPDDIGGTVSWRCAAKDADISKITNTDAVTGTMDSKYVPANCR